jgi:hypothetical protein
VKIAKHALNASPKASISIKADASLNVQWTITSKTILNVNNAIQDVKHVQKHNVSRAIMIVISYQANVLKLAQMDITPPMQTTHVNFVPVLVRLVFRPTLVPHVKKRVISMLAPA